MSAYSDCGLPTEVFYYCYHLDHCLKSLNLKYICSGYWKFLQLLRALSVPELDGMLHGNTVITADVLILHKSTLISTFFFSYFASSYLSFDLHQHPPHHGFCSKFYILLKTYFPFLILINFDLLRYRCFANFLPIISCFGGFCDLVSLELLFYSLIFVVLLYCIINADYYSFSYHFYYNHHSCYIFFTNSFSDCAIHYSSRRLQTKD